MSRTESCVLDLMNAKQLAMQEEARFSLKKIFNSKASKVEFAACSRQKLADDGTSFHS